MITAKPINFDKDMNQILSLIKNDLDSTFNEEFFIWKHLENPFGKSFAMGAWDTDKLVGLRMFMRWEFMGSNNELVKAIRPVDTVTHSEYRGKGIFKSLTLKGLELTKSEYDIVFNTPNQNSLPGYLKMGWDKIKFNQSFIYAIVNPFSTKSNDIFFTGYFNDLEIDKHNVGETYLSKDYLRWRYKEKSFCFAHDSNQTLVVYKAGKFRGLKTIMVYETCGENKKISNIISAIASKEKTIIFYGFFGNRTKYLNFKFVFKRNMPVVVWRDDSKSIHQKLSFSLGDLEGKL